MGPALQFLSWHFDMQAWLDPRPHTRRQQIFSWSLMKVDLLRSKPLHGDLQTRSTKQKGVATDNVGDEDLHRPNTIL